MRIFALLELIASKDEFVTLGGLVEESGVPKPTLHRMLRQLEDSGLLIRQSDGRHFGTGARLRTLAENILLNATQYGAAHGILRALVEETGETCNITALSGDEVLYLDRIETTAPLRFHLEVGSRVPVHASASGKVLLSQMSPEQRHKLLGHAKLQRFTTHTKTSTKALMDELDGVAERGWAVDDEEFLDGLVCAAVAIPAGGGRSNRCVAVQAPAIRLGVNGAEAFVPALRKAATAMAAVEEEGRSGTENAS
jgi:IclR family transcriptional regulator, acetate operon repressor